MVTRRDFVQLSAAATAALGISSAHAQGGSKSLDRITDGSGKY